MSNNYFFDVTNHKHNLCHILYLKELEDLGEDKDEEYFKYKQSLKDYEDKKVDEDLLRILMFNLNEQKLSKLYFTQLLIEHMEISNVKVTLLDKIEPIKKNNNPAVHKI